VGALSVLPIGARFESGPAVRLCIDEIHPGTSEHARLAAAISAGHRRSAGRMGNSGLKAITALLALKRHSKRRGNWTLSIAIFSTLVTIGLFALYLMVETPELP
jgi:hypothetical protein